MSKLELWFPTRPYVVTQGWGIYNPAYLQFGFSKHNGVDFVVDEDGIVVAPCDAVVAETGYKEVGAGNYVVLKTDRVIAEGTECYVYLYFMHGKEILVKTGDTVLTGDKLMVADNTGFSTGPHTHMSAFRVDENNVRLDTDTASNQTFDPSKYFNGYYAGDKNKVLGLYNAILLALRTFIDNWKTQG